MKSIIKRLKRRSSPTTAPALMGPPVSLQVAHKPKDTAPSSHGKATRTTELLTPPSNNSSPQIPSSSRVPSEPAAADSQNESQEIVTPHNISSVSCVAIEGSPWEPSCTSRVSTNSEGKRSGLSDMEEKLRETEKEEFTKASSIRTFGDKPDSQHQARLRQGLPDDSERDSITYYEEKHTLKPVIRETIHNHIVEEVQKVNLHERHLTYIQQHVQPIINPKYEIELEDYRIGLQHPPGPQADGINIDRSSKLDTIIRDLILDNKRRYETEGGQSFSRSKSVGFSDIEHQAPVVHNYHIIQPVLVKPSLPLGESSNLGINKHGVLTPQYHEDRNKKAHEENNAQVSATK
ncbi:hypothetical protein PCASD_14543 [Puccinia coronata f. sp. avenae]|uniref:Uncharacterized protein n=1 Tax=Puccinia coronata f. sp. avenae TaxID=200324 RepID=A0A2N5T9T6_9BASI|nr:hypothetical protein PCASD_14543 [Puccinia coronata f. sp. avenae]